MTDIKTWSRLDVRFRQKWQALKQFLRVKSLWGKAQRTMIGFCVILLALRKAHSIEGWAAKRKFLSVVELRGMNIPTAECLLLIEIYAIYWRMEKEKNAKSTKVADKSCSPSHPSSAPQILFILFVTEMRKILFTPWEVLRFHWQTQNCFFLSLGHKWYSCWNRQSTEEEIFLSFWPMGTKRN